MIRIIPMAMKGPTSMDPIEAVIRSAKNQAAVGGRIVHLTIEGVNDASVLEAALDAAIAAIDGT